MRAPDRKRRGPSASTPSAAPSQTEQPQAFRFNRIDAWRGAALVWMAGFHFCFDLSNAQLIHADFYSDPLWTTQRTCILSLFLLCAGAGQAVATQQGQSWLRFWQRWVQIVACSLLVSLGSWLMFPDSFIYFGVLQGMAVMLIVARLTAAWRAWLWPLGLLALCLPLRLAHPFFDTRLTNWVGLVTHKPITEDHVPVLPWLGVMWWGLAGTQWLLRHKPQWLTSFADHALVAHATSRLAVLGRWSLTFYMVHQPILLGALATWTALTGHAASSH